jgi:hypothetical protein
MPKKKQKKRLQPPQHQSEQAGRQYKMKPQDHREAARADLPDKYSRDVFPHQSRSEALQEWRGDLKHILGHHRHGQPGIARLFIHQGWHCRLYPVAFTVLGSEGNPGECTRAGPIWTPLIPATFSAKEVATFGANVPIKRGGQPEEAATCFVFLALTIRRI